ncbi:MAG: energy-coupling factor transporter transmembrane protein EcfT [Lachnospiraceae bacterium]|nr:energy-coupling factor transporter transmembrane protein EcfT [Lachnospiraceae bacterium]
MKRLDIRVRLAAMLLVALAILLIRSEITVYVMLVYAILWTGLIVGWKRILPQIVFFAGLEVLLLLLKNDEHIGNLPLLIIYIRRLLIAVIMAYPVANAPTGKLIASLDRLKIPRAATISLAVLFRFMPTVKNEYAAIRQAQRYREIGTSVKSVFLKLPQLFEYTIVPLLIRTTKIADELTASAEVRGMKLEGDYNPYYEVKMKAFDLFALLLSIVIPMGICFMDHRIRMSV